jgi:3'(2'), 5'-bisphosphate nucleotidase
VIEQLLGADATEAVSIVWDAVRLARIIRRDAAFRTFVKGDGSPVTIADLAIDALVSGRLARRFPHDSLVAEEDDPVRDVALSPSRLTLIADLIAHVERGVTPRAVASWVERSRCRSGSRCWVLDPIDGTKGFLRGRQYVVALALIVDGHLSVGVVGCPCYSPVSGLPSTAIDQRPGAGGVAVAVRDRGAWWITPDGRDVARLCVSRGVDIRRARLLTSHEGSHTDRAQLERTLTALGILTPPLPLDSQAKHVVLAAGRADLLLRLPTADHARESIWDQAAGALLIAEAGGCMTDLAGHALDFSTGRQLTHNSGILASNGELHGNVLEAVAAMLAGEEESCGSQGH